MSPLTVVQAVPGNPKAEKPFIKGIVSGATAKTETG